MDLKLDFIQATEYKSSSQIARIVTEYWGKNNLFCPNCGCSPLSQFPDNKKVSDFFCSFCREEYQLKSSKKIGKKIIGAAYEPLKKRIMSDTHPNLFLLEYDMANSIVTTLLYIPKAFFKLEFIEKRDPLPAHARRAGWIGSIIHLEKIPPEGIFTLIRNGKITSKSEIIKVISDSTIINSSRKTSRRWYDEILKLVKKMSIIFTLKDFYKHEEYLKTLFPNNDNIKAKIRQQLQYLRNDGFIEFIGRGKYQKKTKGNKDLCKNENSLEYYI